jgi:uncharacterized protein
MSFEFDPAKNAENRAKHRLSLSAAIDVFDGPFIEEVDDRSDYGETRFIATGPIPAVGGRLFVVVYTWRNANRRLISFRKANEREVRKYHNSHT